MQQAYTVIVLICSYLGADVARIKRWFQNMKPPLYSWIR